MEKGYTENGLLDASIPEEIYEQDNKWINKNQQKHYIV